MKYSVGDDCVYYDTVKRKLLTATVKSINFSCRVDGDGEHVTSTEYYIETCGGVRCGINEYLLFNSKEHFLSEVL